MEYQPLRSLSEENIDESISFREIVEKYAKHYKWFLISLFSLLVFAFFKLLFEVPTYKVDASILIKESQKGTSIADLSAFEDLGLFGNPDNSIENEMEIIKSRRLITKMVKELKLNINYFIEDFPINKEVYPNYPIFFQIKSDSATADLINSNIRLSVISAKEFEFFDSDKNSIGVFPFGQDFKVNIGNDKNPDIRIVNVVKTERFSESLIGEVISIVITPVDRVAEFYLNTIEIEPVDERLSKVIKLSLKETNVEKGVAILNNLVEQYNADGVYDKNLISKATTDFLDDRLVLISNEIEAIESSAAVFKSNKGIVDDGTAGASIYLQSSSIAESEVVYANTQLQLVNYMLSELNRTNQGELLPGNIGLSDPSIVSMIAGYNDLVLQRNRILRSSSDKNPMVVEIDSQLIVLKNNLVGSLNALKSSAQIQIDAVRRKSGNINSKIASAPKYEQEFKGIVRDQETKNALYLFLLQKREESILSNAVKVEKAKIVDAAYSNGDQVTPNSLLNYLGAGMLGLLIPFLIIYFTDLMDTKVHDQKDLQKLRIPYLGDVPYSHSQKTLYIKDGDNTSIAEAFRYVRTNINFMLDNKKTGKVVFITSTQSGEGKTFAAINLANSLAISGKKTLLLGMDLRAPKVNKYLNMDGKNFGVTNYIKDSSIQIESITNSNTNFENLHIIHSGDIPPNPVELLMSKRVKDLFEEAELKYDFIIVDTAPVGMVTDTMQVASFADLTIFVIKANSLDKRMLHIPEKLNHERKLPNMAFLINATDHSKGAYGYGYGYKYGNKKKSPWYKRIFNKKP